MARIARIFGVLDAAVWLGRHSGAEPGDDGCGRLVRAPSPDVDGYGTCFDAAATAEEGDVILPLRVIRVIRGPGLKLD
jgi:hypothetical protein